jgi:hypothetical protein
MPFWSKKPKYDHTSLANILVGMRLITHMQAREAIETQGNKYVGQRLLDLGYVTQENLDDALEKQHQLRFEVERGRPRKIIDKVFAIHEENQNKVLASVRELTKEAERVVSAPELKRST